MLSMIAYAAAVAGQPVDATALLPICKDIGPTPVQNVAPQGEPRRAQKLNELPNADHYLTVLRKDENGCSKPVIVRYDIGSAPPGGHSLPQR